VFITRKFIPIFPKIYGKFPEIFGLTENAGVENAAPSK